MPQKLRSSTAFDHDFRGNVILSRKHSKETVIINPQVRCDWVLHSM